MPPMPVVRVAEAAHPAEDEARTRGAKRLVLSVYVENFPAQKFYAARGFETIGRWVFEGFESSEDFIVAKTL